MPARRKAASGKKSTGRQKRALRNVDGHGEARTRRPDAKAIEEKTPRTRKDEAGEEQSASGRRRRKSGVADSAVTDAAPKPASNKVTTKKTSAKTKSKERGTAAAAASGSGQKSAVRKRASAPAPSRARKQATGGDQARTSARKTKTSSRRSGT